MLFDVCTISALVACSSHRCLKEPCCECSMPSCRHSEAKQQSTSSTPEAPAKPVRKAAQAQQDMGNQEDESIMKPLEGERSPCKQ